MGKANWRTVAAVSSIAGLLSVGCLPSLQGNEPRDARQLTAKGYEVQGQTPPVTGSATTSAAQQRWSEFFASPELRELIQGALKNNQELNIQLQEMVIAQAEILSRQGDYLPRLSAGVTVGVEKAGRWTREGAVDEALGLPEDMGNFAFGLLGSWEVDIWGRLRNAAHAANLRYLASQEGRKFMVTRIVAEIARSYYELIAIDNQLEVLSRNIQIQSDALEVVRLEKEAARVTELAVQRFEAEVLKNRSRQFALEQARIQAENRINFLAGRSPQPVARNATELKASPSVQLQTGLPTDLLKNRPDVRRAELELEAAKLDVQAAKAAFLPALSFEAGIGYRTFNPEHLLTTPESLIYNAAGNLVAPLLNRNAITAQYRGANARQIQAVYEYERAMLNAYTDVVNQLAMVENFRKSYELRARQVEILKSSVEVSNVLFQSARADYMEVLLTRRDALEAEMDLIDTKLAQYLALVNVYQALGGGWRGDDRK